MLRAWIHNNVVRDTCHGDPATLYHPDIAAMYTETVPDGTVIGATQVVGVWTNPALPEPPPAPTPPAPVVPQSVTMRQAVLALLDADMLDDIEAIVAALPRRYQLEWERAANVYRDNALVETVRQQKSMTAAQIDDLFIAAFAL